MNTGDLISRYCITGPLGKGGMGVVYIAEDLRLGRPVALKFLPEDALDSSGRNRFLNEARAAAQVRHPNICPIYDIEDIDGRCFIAMALIDGETLAKHIKRGPLKLSQVLDIGRQIAAGLAAAHTVGVVHRDIKSNNIMLDSHGHVSILDFGLALRGGEERLTVVGRAIGTPAYMSPEQLRAEEIDSRSDIWAVGVVLHEMATGKLPRRDGTDLPLPDGLSQIVAKALEQNPDKRWQSAKDLSAALDRLDRNSQTHTFDRLPTGAAAKKRSWWPLAIVGAALLGVIGWGVSRLPLQKPEIPVPAAAIPAVRRVAILPLKANGDSAQVVSDALIEVWADAIGNSNDKIWAVPVSEIRTRKLVSVQEARRAYGVELAVSGSADMVGKDVKLVIQLIDTATLKPVGERTLLYSPSRAIKSRDSAVNAVLQLLSLPAKSPRPTKEDAGAYGAYLEGRGLMARFDKGGYIERAITSFKSAVEHDPNFALAYAALGEAYWVKSREGSADAAAVALALQNARRAVALDASLAVAHVKLGEILGATGKHAEAIAELRHALELSPGNAEAHLELADIYDNQGLFAEAERSYHASVDARPTNWLGPYTLALFLEKQGRLAECKVALAQAASFAPENETIIRQIGRIYRTEGRYADAVVEFQRALAITPTARTYNSLAMTYYYQRQFKKAVVALESAIDLDSQGHQYWGNYGAACRLSPEDKDKAIPALRKAVQLAEKRLALTPTRYSAMADLAEYHSRLGEGSLALREIERIPLSARPPLAGRIITAFELSGKRSQAIAAFKAYYNGEIMLREILDEPILDPLKADPAFERAVTELRSKPMPKPN